MNLSTVTKARNGLVNKFNGLFGSTPTVTTTSDVSAFSFGEPESVLSNSLVDYLGVFYDSHHNYYVPPVSLDGLAKLLGANAHHNTLIHFRNNVSVMGFKPNPVITKGELKRASFDLITFGNMYFQRITNKFGHLLRLKHIRALGMRRMKEKDKYCFIGPDQKIVEFKAGEIIHVATYDVKQDVYGVPEYLGSIQAVLLNESATLFRRKYYNNGAHMGYILFTNDPNMSPEDEQTLKEQISKSKGVGNFRSLYLNIPSGDKDAVQIIPVGDIATKDEFDKVKNITRNDIVSGHRVNPALAAIMPEEKSNLGDIKKAAQVYYQLENEPFQEDLARLNEFLDKRNQIVFERPNHGIFAESI